MKRLVATCFLLIALATAPSVLAITYGAPDGNGHPEVGALLAAQAYSDGTWAMCSGHECGSRRRHHAQTGRSIPAAEAATGPPHIGCRSGIGLPWFAPQVQYAVNQCE